MGRRQRKKWIPYFMSYQYADNEITLSYARWNEKHQSYDKDVRKSVYEMNAENMPVAYKKQPHIPHGKPTDNGRIMKKLKLTIH